jgi:glucodextranase-like protein
MLVVPRYSKHSSSGRLLSHRDTSYGLLLALVLGVGALLGGATLSSRADACGGGGYTSCSSSYVVNAVVPPARPGKPANITSPTNGQTFTTDPVTVSGTCPSGSLVKIFTNGILVGSVICSASGQFSVPVDLVIGSNALTALPFNALDQQGPTSPTVTVTLNQPAGGPGFSTQLLLQSVNYYRGVPPGQEVTWPITIVGGQAPYSVSIDWGDGTTDLITRVAPGPFTVTHTYKEIGTGYLGTFPLIIRGSDAAGHTAYLQLTTLVNSAMFGTTNAAPKTKTNTLLIIWPIWIVILLMILSFWLGERREKHIMEKRLEALA